VRVRVIADLDVEVDDTYVADNYMATEEVRRHAMEDVENMLRYGERYQEHEFPRIDVQGQLV